MVTYRIRKMIAWGMAVTMTAGMTNVLTGCGAEREGQAVETSQVEDTSQGDEDTPAWKKYAGEPVTLDWYVNYSWFAIPWGENAVSQKITEETGVNINFITPIGNETEKLNALIASDSLPDLITLGYWAFYMNKLSGVIGKFLFYLMPKSSANSYRSSLIPSTWLIFLLFSRSLK